MVAYLALGARLCVLLYLVYILPWTNAGHEVLYKYKPGQNDLKPEDLAIIQFDSRPLDSYWNTSARWNKAYSEKWGHQYYYLSNKGNCRFGPHLLAEPWCKVKAMVVANKHEKLKRAKAFLFLDSDVVITVNYSMTSAIGYIQRDLHWNATEKPVALNQDGPGWSCKFTLNLGYSLCLNSGTVFWMRSQAATDILEDWWLSSGEQYKVRNKFPSKWRVKWPWEQAQLYEVHKRHADQIMILTFPNIPHLPWTSNANPKSQYPTDTIEPYCLSHWPGAGCFITHHCSSKNQKLKLQADYDLPHQYLPIEPIYID